MRQKERMTWHKDGWLTPRQAVIIILAANQVSENESYTVTPPGTLPGTSMVHKSGCCNRTLRRWASASPKNNSSAAPASAALAHIGGEHSRRRGPGPGDQPRSPGPGENSSIKRLLCASGEKTQSRTATSCSSQLPGPEKQGGASQVEPHEDEVGERPQLPHSSRCMKE